MATKTAEELISQAISDFDNVESAIEACGVDVPYGTDTSEYGNKVIEVYEKGLAESAVEVDGALSYTSENPVQNRIVTAEFESITTKIDTIENNKIERITNTELEEMLK